MLEVEEEHVYIIQVIHSILIMLNISNGIVIMLIIILIIMHNINNSSIDRVSSSSSNMDLIMLIIFGIVTSIIKIK